MRGQRVPVPGEPPLDVAEQRQLRRMQERLVAESVDGWLSFEKYMDLVLYAPGLGYYSAGARKFGRDGDFTTAPELSRLFGACVAQHCAQVLAEVGGGSLLEIGAGSGRLAIDVLTRLETLNHLPQEYRILEVSGDLRQRQKALIGERLPHLAERVTWLDGPSDAAFDGVIIANEVLDALPVARFRWSATVCEELGVTLAGDHWAYTARPAGPSLQAMCDRWAAAYAWDDGYVSEYCPRLGPWTSSVTRALRRGTVLWVDYGLPRAHYYLSERHDGTLLCHFRQRAHGDPFLHPGLQDITAWVDFTALAESGDAAGFEIAGFATQALFLAGSGIDREMQQFAGDDQALFARLANEARQLMMPGEMGERFKAMAWCRGLSSELSGFSLQDLRHSL